MDKYKMGEFLTELRLEKNLSQQELSDIVGITPQAISKWERGESIPDISILEQLSEIYNISINEIISGTRKSLTNDKKKIGFFQQKRTIGFILSISFLLFYLLLALISMVFGYNNTIFGSIIYFIRSFLFISVSVITVLFSVCELGITFKKVYLLRNILMSIALLFTIISLAYLAVYFRLSMIPIIILEIVFYILLFTLPQCRKTYLLEDFN